jgi:hypothetical protein
LSTEEYYDCKLRLETGEARQKVVKSSISFSDVWAALGQDLNYLISDPEVIRRKKLLAHEQSQSSLSLPSPWSSSSESPSPAHARTQSNEHSIADDHLSDTLVPGAGTGWCAGFAAGAETATSNAGHAPKP